MFTTRVITAAALTVAMAALVAGCDGVGSGSSSKLAPPAAAGMSVSALPAALPAGISPLGSTVPVASQGWTLSLQPFQQTTADTSSSGVPAGWIVLRTQARF
ncbi:MAG: hypothetical protein JO362_01680 [Streptomycetaceae bacterium]|nr:hypothetical protein [Streptomycetaceae bacterium]